jgi:hypothetical protein
VSHAAPAHHFSDANGLLTGLAAEGYRRFVAAQEARQKIAPSDGMANWSQPGWDTSILRWLTRRCSG